MKNHSAESGSGWNNTYWLSSNSNYEVNYSDLDKLYGNRSFEIYGEQGSENGGGAFYQVFTTDELEPGKDYTFSGYIKTVNVTKANNVDAAYGGCLAVRFTSSSGSFTRLYSDYITDTSPTGYNNGWRRVKLSFTVPTNATEVRVYMVLRNSNGTAFFDGLQLETGTSANAYNLLSNSSFEKISSNKPSEWTLVNNNSNDGNSSTHYFSGTTALKFEGEASVNKYAYQNVAVSGTESDIYIASGWAWAEALPDAEGITRSFDIFARVYYSDGTSVLKSKKAEFNRDVTGWQRASMAFDLNDGDDTKKRTPTEIRVGVRYYKQENEAYFDSLQLVKDIANSYTYDKDGNLITAKENGSQSSALNYDDNSNLTSLTDAENNLYEYEYNTKHQVTEATAPLGQKISYTYKSKGPLSSTEISSPGGDLKLKTDVLCNNSSGGINAQAYVTQEKDQNGYITRYNVDLVSGRTNSVITPDGTVTSYSYNTDNDLLTSVSSGGKTVSYNYDSSQSKLLSIGHNGFNYNFTYDVFGNVLSTSVGSQALSTNTYAANNGKLTTITYGNEDTKSYTYTKAGNLSTIKENGTKTDSWTYNYSQQPMTYTDHETGQKHSYSYDITGRLLETTVSDTTVTDTAKDSRRFTALYGYDELNRLERERVYAGTRSPYAIYSYNENSQASKVDFSNGRSLSYTYDSLGRLTGKDYSTTTVLEYDYLYHTSKRAETEGTQYKTTQVKNELMGNMGYRYTYDEMGNITLIEEGTRKAGTVNTLKNLSDKISYVYDDQSQLIRENNLYLDKTIVYTYDNGGNIVSRAEYDYTTDEDLSGKTVKSSINYTYDSTWKDLLKSYNGSNITYDEIGNPLNYLGKTMVWNGRTLESLTEDGTTISYDYNSDGLRTRKTVGNKTHEYYYSNGQLAYEKRSDGKEVFYTYDADGLLVLIQYVQNGSHVYYYPMLNSRGDVEALYTYQGELVARYYYDTWGNVIGIKDASGNDITATDHIANVNPIRYRGYYYDAETGFYYVSSRYYDPEVGRWINADDPDILEIEPDSLIHYNLYSYCWNNPVNMIDDSGFLPWFVTAAAVGALSDSILYLVSSAIRGNRVTWSGIVKAAVTGALSGVAIGAIGKSIRTAINAGKFAKGGIRIINKKYANKTLKLTGDLAKKYGKGIKFNKYGFPNFRKYAKYTTKIKGLTGVYKKDAAMANARVGLKRTPTGYTWHHVEDGLTMILIPSDLHRAVKHTGGAALIRNLLKSI